MRTKINALALFVLMLAAGPLRDSHGSEIAETIKSQPQQAIAEIDLRIACLAGINIAERLRVKKQYRQAIAVLDSMEERYGTSGELVLTRGAIKQQAKLHKSAVADFSQAIQMNCHRAEAYACRGTSRFALGDRKDAFEDLDLAVESGPTPAASYLARGRVRFLDGQTSAALDDFDKLIQIAPADSGYYAMRASCHTKLGHYDAVIADATSAIQLDPTKPKPFYLRAGSNAKLGNWDAVLADYDSLVAIEGTAKAYAGRASSHLQIGNYDAAVTDATSALQLDPHFLIAVKIRAAANAKLGKMKQASADVELAKEMGHATEQQKR